VLKTTVTTRRQLSRRCVANNAIGLHTLRDSSQMESVNGRSGHSVPWRVNAKSTRRKSTMQINDGSQHDGADSSPQRGDPVPESGGTNTATSWPLVGKSTASDSAPNNFINTSSCFSNPRDCHQRQYLGIADNTLEHYCFYVATLNKTQALRSNSAEQLDQHRPVHGAESHQTSACHPLSHPQSSPHQSHPQSESHRLKHQWKPSATIAKLRSAYTKLPPP